LAPSVFMCILVGQLCRLGRTRLRAVMRIGGCAVSAAGHKLANFEQQMAKVKHLCDSSEMDLDIKWGRLHRNHYIWCTNGFLLYATVLRPDGI
jgi:hypothetical protein